MNTSELPEGRDLSIGPSTMSASRSWNAKATTMPAPIAAHERMVGRQALEIEFLKGALKSAPRPRSVSTSVITGPVASPSPKDAG